MALQADDQVIVLDVDAVGRMPNGDRAVSFYAASRLSPNDRRVDALVDCAGRRVKLTKMAEIDPVSGNVVRDAVLSDKTNEGDWQRSDGDSTGARITDLVCAKPADRDRFGERLPREDWRSALALATDSWRGPLERSFGAPRGPVELRCTGGGFNPEKAPASSHVEVRLIVDMGKRKLRLLSDVASDVPTEYDIPDYLEQFIDFVAPLKQVGMESGTVRVSLDFSDKKMFIRARRSDRPDDFFYVYILACAAAHPLP